MNMMHEHHPLLGREIIARAATPLVIRAAADCARFSLRIDSTELAAASKALELKLPAKISELAASGEKIAVCLGPDEWHVIVPLAAGDAVQGAFADLYAQASHSLVDISHREVAIEIEGTDAALVLQSAIPLDVETMPVASGCRTVFGKAQIVLVRKAVDRFRIEVWRSFADHVWGLLRAGAREIELGV
jgi:sarcosine oxidase subunit gamma